jgi:hypothetical protein
MKQVKVEWHNINKPPKDRQLCWITDRVAVYIGYYSAAHSMWANDEYISLSKSAWFQGITHWSPIAEPALP